MPIQNNYVHWTKVYLINHDNGQFKFYLSSNKDGYFYGLIIYYLKTGSWSEDTDVELDFKDQRIYSNSEDAIMQALREWLNLNLIGNYKIILLSETDM